MKNIIKIINNNYTKLLPKEGFLITSFNKDTEDIKIYNSYSELYISNNEDISKYKSISLDESKLLELDKLNALKELL